MVDADIRCHSHGMSVDACRPGDRKTEVRHDERMYGVLMSMITYKHTVGACVYVVRCSSSVYRARDGPTLYSLYWCSCM